MPKVSVIIPTYNRADVVVDAIRSVLAQTIPDLEVIVVDDGSTDNTHKAIEAIGDSRIRYFYKQNSGPAGARNVGLDQAQGDYIAFLDSDDYWPKNYLETMIDKLQQYPDYGAIYSPITIIFQNGKQIKSYKCPKGKEGWITSDLFKSGFIWPSASLFRAECWKDFSFDEGLARSSEDSDAFVRLSAKTQFCFTAKVESCHRISDDSIAANEGVNPNRLLSLERFYFRLGGNQLVPKHVARKKLAKSSRRLAKHYHLNKMRNAAIMMYKKAIRYQPLNLKLYISLLKSMGLSRKTDAAPDWKPSVLADEILSCRKVARA